MKQKPNQIQGKALINFGLFKSKVVAGKKHSEVDVVHSVDVFRKEDTRMKHVTGM